VWRRVLGAALLVSLLPAEVWSAGMTATDLVMMDRLSDSQVSPAGDRVVFVRRRTDLNANRGRTDLWLVGVEGGQPQRLTEDPASDSQPR